MLFCRCFDLPYGGAAPEDLTGKEKEHWQDGVQELMGLGMDDALAEKSLKRGFGWSSQAYWWKDKVNDVPKPGEVSDSSCSPNGQLQMPSCTDCLDNVAIQS